MKQFEMYMADLRPFGSETGTPIIILQNGITDNMETVICAPITTKEVKGDNNIKANAKDGKIVYVITEQMRNVRREKLKEKIGELSEEDHQKVKNRIAELMK